MYICIVWLLPDEVERLKSMSCDHSSPIEKQAKNYLYKLISDEIRWLSQEDHIWPMFYKSKLLKYNGRELKIGMQDIDPDFKETYDLMIEQLESIL